MASGRRRTAGKSWSTPAPGAPLRKLPSSNFKHLKACTTYSNLAVHFNCPWSVTGNRSLGDPWGPLRRRGHPPQPNSLCRSGWPGFGLGQNSLGPWGSALAIPCPNSFIWGPFFSPHMGVWQLPFGCRVVPVGGRLGAKRAWRWGLSSNLLQNATQGLNSPSTQYM